MEWIWTIGFMLLILAIFAGMMYAIVTSVVENRLDRLIRTELDHMDRKQNDRFQLLDRQLQELNGSMRMQEERLRSLETLVKEKR